MTNQFKNIALAAAVAVIAPAVATAAPITLSKFGSHTLANVDLSNSNISGFTGHEQQPAGGFGVSKDGGVSGFTAWCVELTEYLRLGKPDGYDDAITPATITASITENLSRLFTGFETKISTNNEYAAFQVAIWEIVYDGDLDLNAGDFQMVDAAGNTGVQSIAAGYLSEMSKYETSYDMSFFASTSTPGSQDLVTGEQNGGNLNPVPLPAAGLLLLAGLGGLGMVGRRKRTA